MNPKLAVVLAYFALCLVFVSEISRADQDDMAAVKRDIAEHAAQIGYMTISEQDRLTDILISIQTNHSITDGDLYFARHVLETPPPKDTPSVRCRRIFGVLFDLTGLTKVSKSQRELLYQIVSPQLRNSDPLVRARACGVLGEIRAEQARRQIVLLTASPNPFVAHDARLALSRLNK